MLFPSRLRRATFLPEEGFGDPVTEQGDPAGTADTKPFSLFESF